MGKHWVYILHYSAWVEHHESIYIGETTRLYRRLNEHLSCRGGTNTTNFHTKGTVEDIRLVGLYSVSENSAFEDYHAHVPTYEEWYSIWDLPLKFYNWRKMKDNDEHIDYHIVENTITEMCLHLERDSSIDVKGGKYIHDKCYKNSKRPVPTHRPVCECGYPAEVFLSKKDEIWFKCAVANAQWVEFEQDEFSVAEPCNFLQKYTGDKDLRQKWSRLKQREGSIELKQLPELSHKVGREGNWVQEFPCSICKNTKYTPVFNCGFRALCRSCIESRYDEVIAKSNQKYVFIEDSDSE